MAKGGKYLDKNKSKSNTDVIREAKPMTKKKGRGWKIALIILLVLAILAGGAYIAVNQTLDHFIGKINRAEYEERDVDALLAILRDGEVNRFLRSCSRSPAFGLPRRAAK